MHVIKRWLTFSCQIESLILIFFYLFFRLYKLLKKRFRCNYFLADYNLLRRAAIDLIPNFSYLTFFKPTSAIVVTWSNVTFYGGSANIVSIFQVTLFLSRERLLKGQ